MRLLFFTVLPSHTASGQSSTGLASGRQILSKEVSRSTLFVWREISKDLLYDPYALPEEALVVVWKLFPDFVQRGDGSGILKLNRMSVPYEHRSVQRVALPT